MSEEKVVFTKEELSLFERVMQEEYGKREVGLATNSEVEEFPLLRSLVQKIGKVFAIARQQGWLVTPPKD